jgi:hypothetical protein
MDLRSLCIHAHFYQPPREDPLTGAIPYEAGASPFPNWNERIHAECYRPNAAQRNFENISFNIGPTLFSWMAGYDAITVQKIIDQDRANVRRFGVGNAIAQAYNHTILPLASYRDKVTQVRWGIAEFEFRFGRRPQGMWLPETAADRETLQVLANEGIEFTILAPWQSIEEEIDPGQPYRVPLSGGRYIDVFFYHGELGSRLSFDSGATINADNFAEHVLLPYFDIEKQENNQPQLILIASDGELYGHHQHLRDLFLARLVDGAITRLGIHPTFPALWLKNHPPTRDIQIRDATSWSCHHGVMRWTGSCPCTPGDGSWKLHLRNAFERLAGALDGLFMETVRQLVPDPWLLRERYIHVILGQMTIDELLGEMINRVPTSDQMRRVHLLLEAQRERQRMFTSCGWFFDDFDRIEPKNNVAYAAQSIRLARLATEVDLEPYVVSDLRSVVSQYTGQRADRIFQNHLRRAEGVSSVRIGFAD